MDELPILLPGLAPFPAELSEHPVCGEACMGFCFPYRGQIAGPFSIFRSFGHLCAYRIQDHVPAYFEKMAVFLDQDSLVPALEQMTGPAVPFVEELGIHSVQLSHAEGKITVGGLDKEVIMVGHEAVGVADPVVAFIDVLEGVQELEPILVGLENGLPLIAPGGDMIDGTGVFDSEGPGHERRISEAKWKVKLSIPDPETLLNG